MKSALQLLTRYSFLGDSRAHSVSQPDTSVTVSGEFSLQLRGNYSSTLLALVCPVPRAGFAAAPKVLFQWPCGSQFERFWDWIKQACVFLLHEESLCAPEQFDCIFLCSGFMVSGATGGAEHKHPWQWRVQTQGLSLDLWQLSFSCLCTTKFQLKYPLSGYVSEGLCLFSKLYNAHSWFRRM